MLSGDTVQFRIATDIRNGSRRATKVSIVKLIEDQQLNSTREKVMIASNVMFEVILVVTESVNVKSKNTISILSFKVN